MLDSLVHTWFNREAESLEVHNINFGGSWAGVSNRWCYSEGFAEKKGVSVEWIKMGDKDGGKIIVVK